MIATGRPSAKLGSTSRREAVTSSRTSAFESQPVIVTESPMPCRAMRDSSSSRKRALTGEHETYGDPVGDQLGDGVEQEELALLLGEPTDARDLAGVAHRRRLGPDERGVEPTSDHLDPGPVPHLGPAHQLAPPEAADGDDELRRSDLLGEVQRLGAVELLGSVHREAERGTAQALRQHGDQRGVRPEVRVHVVDAVASAPPGDDARLGDVDQVHEQPTLTAATDRHRLLHGAPQRSGTTAEGPQQRAEQCPRRAPAEHHTGPVELGVVVAVDHLSDP